MSVCREPATRTRVGRVCVCTALCGAYVVKCGDAAGGGGGSTKLQKSAKAAAILTFRNRQRRREEEREGSSFLSWKYLKRAHVTAEQVHCQPYYSGEGVEP
jgi:hypothetical protein